MITGEQIPRIDEAYPTIRDLKARGLAGFPHEVVILKDTDHNLGLYDERAGESMARFIGKQLRSTQSNRASSGSDGLP